MRKVERTEAAPADLLEKGELELQKAMAYYGAAPVPTKSYAFTTYKLKAVKDALEKMFHGKCAYCETFYASTQPLDVEHFRPKGAVVDAAEHQGYWWLAMSWDNLLPSCIDCNRKRYQITPKGDTRQVRLLQNTAGYSNSVTLTSGKKDSFPIAATGTRAVARTDDLIGEKPLLLNPCEENPENHLVYYFDTENPVSFVLARKVECDPDYAGDDDLSLKGATSIHVYGLNRLRLVQARTQVLRRLEFLADLAIDLKLLGDELQDNADPELQHAGSQITGYGDVIVSELVTMGQEDQPYSAMVNAWLAEFKHQLESVP